MTTTTNEASALMATVSQTVLSTIISMSGRQPKPKPICLDSIALVLRIRVPDLAPIVDLLEFQGHITIHPNTSNTQRKGGKPSSVSLN